MTTLEEVFLKLAEEVDYEKTQLVDQLNVQENRVFEPISKINKIKFRSKLLSWIPVHVYAILKLRFTTAYRNKYALIYRFIMPIPALILTIVLPKLINRKMSLDSNVTTNLFINDYSTENNPFLFVNKTNTNLDTLIKPNLIVNNQLELQPIKFLNDIQNTTFNNYAGIIYNLDYFTLYYNDSALFSVSYLINTLNNFNSRLNNLPLINASLTTWPQIQTQDASFFDSSSFTTLLILGISFLFPLVSFAAEIVQDRELKCKNQLRLSGCNFLTYWATSFLAYLIQISFLPILLFGIIFIIPPLRLPEFMPSGAVFSLILTTIIYIPCNLLLVMCLSFLFKKKETAMSILATLFNLLFIIPYLITNLTMIANIKTSNILHLVFTIIDPVYAFIGTYSRIAQVYLYQKNLDFIFNRESTNVPFNLYFEFDIFFIPLSYIFGLINILLYAFLLYYIETLKNGINIFQKSPNKIMPNFDVIQNEDSDVFDERTKILDNRLQNCSLILQELRKDFKPSQKFMQKIENAFNKKVHFEKSSNKLAVRNLCLGFKKGEIFGLLGTNGAGKTTTINMITGEIEPDAGSIKIQNEQFNLKNVQLLCDNVSVCPQHNPFWDELTLKEHLFIYASLKKLSDDQIVTLSNEFMKMLNITDHADKQVKTLSGGTKRKLAYAITLFGSPNVFLLDEPSTGLDPQSKRTFWNTILKNSISEHKSTILTTHSMEEAEALCQRIGILVKGELKCLGSSQYLKEKFGTGYTLETKFDPFRIDDYDEIITKIFQNKIECIESFSDRRAYNVPKESVKSLAYVFQQLEKAKLLGLIKEYSFSQSTLEQVFIKFAKEQDSL
ncbi:unnamed protein product [Brachionus calyciflorus]|uniref:ABC transporter domain-containing protein n=1 Tax=Brachionus calyciflorus TaxID=104777 RepID=A0A814HKQ8_9BILA|nr:unnamed protein product [Brachionus calyciflorus]